MSKAPANDDLEGSKPLVEYTIPRATIARIMRQVLPQDSKVTDGAKDIMDECIVEFSAALTRAAIQECQQNRRRTVNADDLIIGLANLGLADYVRPISEYLRLYREKGKKPAVEPPAPVAPPAAIVEAEEPAAAPPSLDLTLQLGLPSMPDVTELGPGTDVHALWPGATAAGTSRAPMMPTPADDDDEDE